MRNSAFGCHAVLINKLSIYLSIYLRYERGSPTYMYSLFAVHIASWLICNIFYLPPVCILDIYSPANNNKALSCWPTKNTNEICFNVCSISLDIINFKWTSEHYLEDCLKNLEFSRFILFALLPNKKVL